MRIKKITDCLDLMAGFELQERTEQKQTLLLVIDTLCGYPKPQHKTDVLPSTAESLGAYLFVSNVRNTCKLGELGYLNLNIVHNIIIENLANALSLLHELA